MNVPLPRLIGGTSKGELGKKRARIFGEGVEEGQIYCLSQ